jgi:hypothetical protein
MRSLVFGLVALASAAPAAAQDSLAYKGSGTRAGGPAYLYYDNGQVDRVMVRPTTLGPRDRSGQMSGGPAREFITWDSVVPEHGSVTFEPRYRSGQGAGGPAREFFR